MRERLRRVAATAWTLLPAAALAVLLGSQLSADPAQGVTFSNSPFTDEAWNALAARNAVLLGDPGAGNWALHLVQLPFTVLLTAGFALLGVGLVQARLVALLCTVGTVAAIGLVVGRRLGTAAGLVSAAALASCALLLYYGRLVYIETLVLLALAAGLALLVRGERRPGWAATVAGGTLLAVAIGTKQLGAFSAAGILLGAGLAARDRAWTARLAIAALVIAVLALAWALLLGLPNAREIGWVLQIWPPQTMPAGPVDALQRLVSYLRPGPSDQVTALALPLLAAGLAGLVAVAVRWRALTPGQRVLAGAAIGWLLLGLGVVALAAYRPSRYALPSLPAVAILAGFAVQPARAWWSRLPGGGALGSAGRGALAGLAVALLIGPGLAAQLGWALTADHRGPQLQEQVAAAIAEDPAPIEGGLAPFFAMRAPVPIYVRWSLSSVNTGDLYAEAGVRWMLLTGTQFPAWADRHPEAWEGRQELGCYAWGEGRHCLLHFP